MPNEQLERGLQASVKIFQLAQAKLAEIGEADALSLTKSELVAIKKAAAAMNRALTALVRKSHDEENRMTLELHMLRSIMKREHTDREANRARVFELFRRYSGNEGSTLVPAAQAASTSSSNPLNTPSAAAMAVDRALAALERIDQSVRDLSPVGRVNTHGAGLLSAKLKREAVSETASAAAGGAKGKRARASAST
tara:strand:+ start:593 stop:1180 length:588 start_codon:yes stop_codon:yes gene_type:complete